MKQAGEHDAAVLVAKFVRIAMDYEVLEEVCSALEDGKLTPDCTAVTYANIARGNAQVESAIGGLLKVWRDTYSAASPQIVSLVLKACGAAVQRERLSIPRLEVVWTGPRTEGSFVRATKEVVRELINGANNDLLIVGFWFIAKDNTDGPMSEIVDCIFRAIGRGVKVTMILDERKRKDGRDNKTILLSVWPDPGNPPRLLTWKLPGDDPHLKLHAKVLVADQKDALITSANLTDYAMSKNIEMGVHVTGESAAAIARHFLLLEEDETLTEL